MRGISEPWALAAMSPYTRRYYENEVEKRPHEVYARRIENVGFRGLGQVLDLACGLGQWSVVLAESNARVVGVDAAEDRLLYANLLGQAHGRENLSFRWSRMETLPFEDASFDGVFCCNAIHYGDGDAILEEVRRVLRPSGRFYASVNGPGWNVRHLIEDGFRSGNVGAIYQSSRMLLHRGLGLNRNAPYTRGGFRALLERHGFSVLVMGDDGGIGAGGPELGFYPARSWGLTAVFEVVAQRGRA